MAEGGGGSWWSNIWGKAKTAANSSNGPAYAALALDLYNSTRNPWLGFKQPPMSPEQKALYDRASGYLDNSPTRAALAPVAGGILQGYNNMTWNAPKTIGGYGAGTTGLTGYAPGAKPDMTAIYAALQQQAATPTVAAVGAQVPQDPGPPPKIFKQGNIFSRIADVSDNVFKGAIGGAGGGYIGAGAGAAGGALGYKQSSEQKWQASKDAYAAWRDAYNAFVAAGGKPSYTGKVTPPKKKK